jgi:hypothetical protein
MLQRAWMWNKGTNNKQGTDSQRLVLLAAELHTQGSLCYVCPMHAQRCRCALYLVKHSSQCTFIKTAVGFLTREDEAFCNGKWGTGLKENRHSPKTLQIQISWSKSPPAPPHSSSEISGHSAMVKTQTIVVVSIITWHHVDLV